MTITIKEFMETVGYKITESSQYCWNCYGPDALSWDYWNQKHEAGGITINMVFDTKTQLVYEMQVWDYTANREYRWIHPDYKDAYHAEAKQRGIEPEESIDDNKFIDLEVEEDILSKATALMAGKVYDTRIQVPLNLDESEMLLLMTLAHEADLTLNQYVEKLLLKMINEQTDPVTVNNSRKCDSNHSCACSCSR